MVKSELFTKKIQKYFKIKHDKVGWYQSDTVVFQKATSTHKGIYILVVIDIYSRMMGAMIKSNQEADTNKDTFRKIIKKYFNGILPDILTTDGGTEFGGVCAKYFDKKDIEVKVALGDGSTDSAVKNSNSIVERVNGTIRLLINQYEEKFNTELNDKLLHAIVCEYNNRKHRGIKATPKDVFLGDAVPTEVYRSYNLPSKNSNPMVFKVGDSVRVTLMVDDMTSNKKRKILNSRDVYKIVDTKGHRYKLAGVDKWFPYSRLILSKDKVSKFPSQDFDAPDVKPNTTATKKTKKEILKKHLTNPPKNEISKSYNETFANQKGTAMIKINEKDNNPVSKRTRKTIEVRKSTRGSLVKCAYKGCNNDATAKSIYCTKHLKWDTM